MKKDGLNDKFEKPLDPNLDYFDATPTIEQCLKLVQGLAERLDKAEIALEIQGSINQRLIDAFRGMQQRIDILEGNGHKPSALILPPRLDS